MDLLGRIDEQIGGGPRSWSDVTIVRNVGPLVTASPMAGDNISSRGLNALVSAPHGPPTHFLKLRPLWNAHFEREAAVTVRLSQDARCAALLPASQCFVAGPARVLAQSFIEGQALDVLIRTGRAPAWHALAADILHVAAPMLAAIAALGSTAAVERAADLKDDLDVLVQLGLDAGVCAELAGRLRAVSLPLTPQHGDFWPRNVLRANDGWRFLDFESCGELAPPLFDVFHFIRGCADAVGHDGGHWIERWREVGGAARPLADEVRRAAGTLDTQSIEAALVACQVRFAATLHRRGIARSRIEGRLLELAALPRLLRESVVERLLAA